MLRKAVDRVARRMAGRRRAASLSTTTYDYVVVGGGSGGVASARRAAQAGARVAVVEPDALGGTCVNRGCVPKKVMVHAGELRESLAYMPDYGLTGGEAGGHDGTLDSRRLIAHRNAYVRRLNGIYARNLANSGVEHIAGWAHDVDTGRVPVRTADGGELVLEAEHILLAPGGAPTTPPVPGAELGITSDGFFELDELPRSAVVVGGGYIGVELAGLMRALGSEVTVLHRGPALLRGFDQGIVPALQDEMRASGIELRLETEVAGVRRAAAGGLTIDATRGGPLEAEALVFATGRSPSTDGLLAPGSAVRLDEGGHIEVDWQQRTGAPGVYAVGDVTGAAALTPVAIAAGRLLSDRLFAGHEDAALSYSDIPTVVFSHPPIGTVGLTQAEAEAEFGAERVVIHESRFTSMFYGLVQDPDALHKPATVMRVVCARPQGGCEPGDERVVGVHILGRGADEMLQGFAVAVKAGITKRSLDSSVALHPTSAEELVTMQPWRPFYASPPAADR